MTIRLPLWLKKSALTFDADRREWIYENITPLIHKRTKNREDIEETSLSTQTILNVLGHLKVYLLRRYGVELISSDFQDWLEKKEKEELSSNDRRLIEVIRAQRQVPQELLKLKREIQAHLKRCPKRNSTVGKEFLKLQVLKPGILEVIHYISNLREERKKKNCMKRKIK